MKIKTKDLTLISFFTALIAVCSWISIPTAVPFTLQTFAVLLSAGLLGGKRASLTVLAYILLGAVGAPVFSGFTGGIGILFGKTGGYIIGFLGSTLSFWVITKYFGEKPVVLFFSMIIGLVVCYAFGTAWFMVIYFKSSKTISAMTILSFCVIPFIIPDIIKVSLAVFLTGKLKKYTKSRK